MTYGISYAPITYDTPYFGPTPSFWVGQIQTNLAGYNPKVLSYQSPFYGTSYGTPRFYFGPTPVYYVDVATAVTATLNSNAVLYGTVSSTTAVATTLTGSASRLTLAQASLAISATLTADGIRGEYADEVFNAIAGLTGEGFVNRNIQSTTSITVGLTAGATVTRYAGASTSATVALTTTADHIENANSSTSVTVTLTAEVIKGVVAEANLSVIESSANQISTLYYTVTDPLNITVTSAGAVNYGQALVSNLGVSFSSTARVKKANPITDHDTVFYGQLMPRQWAGELAQRQWAGVIQTERDESAQLGTIQVDGILGERNKFATLAQRRWEGMLL